MKSTAPSHRGQTLIIVAVILLAANLRPSITGVGPVISAIEHGTGLSGEIAGLLTTLPLLAFGVISPLAPRLATTLGIERTLFIGLSVLLAGTVLRAVGPAWVLLCGMFLVGSGAAVGNVLLPSLVKRDFPQRIGLMTGIYTATMNVFAGLASGLSVPLSEDMPWGWRGSLASWGILAALAVIVWLPLIRQHHTPDLAPTGSVLRSFVAWQVTLFMGLQSFLFYVNVAWLPTLLHDRGMTLTQGGWMVSLMQLVSLPATFIMPIVASRSPRQRHLVLIVGLLFFVGYLGLLTAKSPALAVIGVICIGFGAGASISLALAFFSLRTRTHQQAGKVSGMAQSIGYVLAALGPVTVGILHSVTGSWAIPLILLLAVVVVMSAFGMGAGRDVFIGERPVQGNADVS